MRTFAPKQKRQRSRTRPPTGKQIASGGSVRIHQEKMRGILRSPEAFVGAVGKDSAVDEDVENDPVHRNAVPDDEVHGPLVEEFRQREAGLGNPAAEELGAGEIIHQGLAGPCPGRTSVDRVVDITPTALRQGWRTAYGIAAIMRVHPGERTWDGTRVTETLSIRSNNCPEGVARTPCAGDSTFTIGDGGRSSRIGQLPGRINRFYDFHITKWRTQSLLHDASRNPDNVDRCQVSCDQQYACGGRVVGRHTVTRTFRKGSHNGQDVTFVDVTKS